MHGHVLSGAFVVVFDHDFVTSGDEGKVVNGGFVSFAPSVGVHRVVGVIESDARADDVDDGCPVVMECSLDERFDLFGISRKGSRDKGGVRCHRFKTNINRLKQVRPLFLESQANFGCW